LSHSPFTPSHESPSSQDNTTPHVSDTTNNSQPLHKNPNLVLNPSSNPPDSDSPTHSTCSKKHKKKTKTFSPTTTPFSLPVDETLPESESPLHCSHRIADRLAESIQAGCSCARRLCKRGETVNGDAYAAAALNGGTTTVNHIFALLAHAVEEEQVSVAQLFGELLDFDLMDLAYAMDTEPESDDQEEPKTLKEALSGLDHAKWRQALIEEFQTIADLSVFRLIARRDVPAGRCILTRKPIFKIKCNEDRDPIRWKARWVVKGFLQVFGLDYDKTTSLTARLETFQILCHIMASEDLAMRQFDVKTAFLHGKLPDLERVYMHQPPGFEDPYKPDHVWMLVKALYGMKQAGRVWNKTFNDALVNEFGFRRITNKQCLYVHSSPDGSFAMASTHVDNTFAIGSSKEELDRLQKDLQSKWEISVGDGSFILGIHVQRDRANRLAHLSQTALIDCIVDKFGQKDAADVWMPMDAGIVLSTADCPSTPEKADMSNAPYRELVGSLQYVRQATRADIVYAVGRLAKFMANPGRKHWDTAICVLCYLKMTRLYRLTLGSTPGTTSLSCSNADHEDSPPPQLIAGMTDSNFAACTDTRRSVSGYSFTLGSGTVSWKSRQQDLVTLSTCEAEYVAASEAACEAVFLRNLLAEIGHSQREPTLILADNQGTIVLTSDQTNHTRMKHIDVRYRYVQERTADHTIAFKYVRSQDNVADIFTKPLPRPAFSELRKQLGIRPPLPSVQEE
jgi:hypothetical protein